MYEHAPARIEEQQPNTSSSCTMCLTAAAIRTAHTGKHTATIQGLHAIPAAATGRPKPTLNCMSLQTTPRLQIH
jgi:hypothetical protein